MPVFTVTHVWPNGNSCSRPVVAECEYDALEIREAELNVGPGNRPCSVSIRQAADPDGQYEAGLRDAAQRARDAEFWDRRSFRRRHG